MDRQRQTPARLLGALAALLLTISTAGCDGPAPRSPVSSAPPETPLRANDDPRIGAGLPAEVRVVGLEHNRLTLALLQKNRGRIHQFRDEDVRCASILADLTAELPASAQAARIPDRTELLRVILRGAMANDRRCSGRIARPTLDEVPRDAGVTADGEGEPMLTDAGLQVIDQMLYRIGASATEADVSAALDAAASAATGLGAGDALAVRAAVSQSQGSLVLWSVNGAGWTELQAPQMAQNLLRARDQQIGFFPGLIGALLADAGGCRAALAFMRALPILQDANLLMASCFLGAAAGTVAYGYAVYHME